MLRWNDVRPLIGAIVGTRLLSLGFVNPGRAMWRYREQFVDVVAFRCERYGGGFLFEFGTTFRANARPHPAPVDCDFRTSDLDLSRTDRFRSYIAFEREIESQRASLAQLAPRIVGEAARWFGSLETLETAFESVERYPERFLFGARQGSPRQTEMIERLRAAIEKTRLAEG